MDLYDDLDTRQRAGQIDGWSSGIKMLQTQLAIKKANLPQTQTKKPLLTPAINLRVKKPSEDDIFTGNKQQEGRVQTTTIAQPLPPMVDSGNLDYDLDVVDEYDPMWPNEYEKLVKGKRDKDKDRREEHRDRSERGGERSERGDRGDRGDRSERGGERERDRDRDRSRRSSGRHRNGSPKFLGLGSKSTEDDTYASSPPSRETKGSGGAAIAPPLSLQEVSSGGEEDNSSQVMIPYGAGSVAAKIMAKYGFRDGQGLGKQEQGMSIALQVEKTSKRGGRIIHEKETMLPPPGPSFSPPSPPASNNSFTAMLPPPPPGETSPKAEPSITEIMKTPSKVVLLRNMVGPGDVDSELEPEVKDECNTKYGDVVGVTIHELMGVVPEDAVRIFVEFKRIESAIKAVVDLNGRFFGGRNVRAGFYDYDKYKEYKLRE